MKYYVLDTSRRQGREVYEVPDYTWREWQRRPILFNRPIITSGSVCKKRVFPPSMTYRPPEEKYENVNSKLVLKALDKHVEAVRNRMIEFKAELIFTGKKEGKRKPSLFEVSIARTVWHEEWIQVFMLAADSFSLARSMYLEISNILTLWAYDHYHPPMPKFRRIL